MSRWNNAVWNNAVWNNTISNGSAIINSVTANIQLGSFHETRAFFGSESDRWVSSNITPLGGKAVRSHLSYGWIGGWKFTCFEDPALVPWANSIGFLLQPFVKSGTAVTYSLSAGTIHTIPGGQTVYVENLKVSYSESMSIRYVEFSLRRAAP